MEVPNPTDCPYYLVSRVTLLATSALKRGLAASGVKQVKPAYLGVLMSLWQEDGPKVIELGRRAGLESSTMTGLLDRMERDKLVARSADLQDRRAQRIFLTELGRSVKNPVLKVVNRTLAKLFGGIPEEELLRTKDLLQRVLANEREGNKQ